MTFSQRLTDLRKRKGWDKIALAARVRVSRQTLHFMERGRNPQSGRMPRVTLPFLFELADAFEMTVAQLLEGVERG